MIKANLLFLFSAKAEIHFAQIAEERYKSNEEVSGFALDSMLKSTNGFFDFIDDDTKKEMEQVRTYRTNLREILDLWRTAKPSRKMSRADINAFIAIKRLIMELLLQKRHSSDQERYFSFLSAADRPVKYLSRSLSAVQIQAFYKNKELFADSNYEADVTRNNLKILNSLKILNKFLIV